MKKPYRLDLRPSTAQELAARNERDGRSGAERYLPFEEEVAAMERGDKERLTLWCTHPDERVRAHLIENKYEWVETGSGEPGVPAPEVEIREWSGARKRLFEYMLAEADDEKMAWTPLLDRASSADWSSMQLVRRRQWPRLMNWLASQRDPDQVRDVLQFRCRSMRGDALKATPAIDTHLVDEAVARGFAETPITHLAGNPHLSLKVADHLALRALEWMKERVRNNPDHWENAGYPKPVIGLLLERYPIDPEVVAEATRMLQALPRETQPHYPDSRWGSAAGWWMDRLLDPKMAGMREEQLLALVDMGLERGQEVELATHTAAGVDLWRAILPRTRKRRVGDHVAQFAEARRDPTIRALLMKSRSPKTMAGMARDADPEYVAEALRTLAPKHPELAADVLRHVSAEALTGIDPTLLAPLLQHSSPDVRLAGVAAVGHLGSTHRKPLSFVR